MENTHDWLSRLLEMIPVRGTLDYRCFLGAPWRIDFPASELGEIARGEPVIVGCVRSSDMNWFLPERRAPQVMVSSANAMPWPLPHNATLPRMSWSRCTE